MVKLWNLLTFHDFILTGVFSVMNNLPKQNVFNISFFLKKILRGEKKNTSWISGSLRVKVVIPPFLNVVFPFLLQVRHNVRPYFLGSPTHKFVYDVITWAATQIAICYTVVPFVLLSVGPSLKFYRLAGQTRTDTKNAECFFVLFSSFMTFCCLHHSVGHGTSAST